MSAGDYEMVTVVVPAYNRREFIEETLRSVCEQTLKPKAVVVVDDGSSDGTAECARQFTAGWSDRYGIKIQVVEQANGGPSAARNRGLSLAQTEFVAFLDADDIWSPEKLEWQVAALVASPSLSGVYCRFHVVDEAGGLLNDMLLETHHGIADSSDRLTSRLLTGNFVYGSASGVVLRREAVGYARFDESLRLAEDWDFWLQLIGSGRRFAFIDRPLVKIRQHRGNLQRDKAGLRIYDLKFFCKWEESIKSVTEARHHWVGRLSNCLVELDLESHEVRSKITRLEALKIAAFLSRRTLLVWFFRQIVSDAASAVSALAMHGLRLGLRTYKARLRSRRLIAQLGGQ